VNLKIGKRLYIFVLPSASGNFVPDPLTRSSAHGLI